VFQGANRVTRLSAGSILDDGVWHDVVVNRTGKSVSLSVDRVTATSRITGDYSVLDLDQMVNLVKLSRASSLPSPLSISNIY
jgi:hypothetical protein